MKRLLYLFAMSFNLIALSQSFPFNDIEYIGAERGLSGNEVYCITQDRNGFIWVVTDIALNRYDGYSFRSWTYDPKDNNSISTGFYTGLVEDINGVLWIPSEVRGLYSFDPYREKFTHYLHQPGNNNSILNDKVYAVEADPDGSIWISSARGLDNFDPRRKIFTHVIDLTKDSTNARIRYALYMDDRKESLQNNQELWMLNNTPGIDRFDTYLKRGTKTYLFPFPSKPGQCMANSTVVLTPNNKDRIWVGSDHNGIYGFDIRKEQYLRITSEKGCSAKMHNNGYYKVWEDSKGNLWTTNDDHEIVYYDQAEKKFYYYPVQKKGIQFLNLIPVIWEDNRNKIWICTNSGLITIDTRQKKIVKLSHDKNDPTSLSGNYVFSIKRISPTQLLVSSDSIEVFDKKTNSFSPFPLMIEGKKIHARGFWDIYKDRRGMLWFTGWAGVVSYDVKNATTRVYDLHTANGKRAFKGCVGIAEDNSGRYWLPSWGHGLYLFDPVTGLVKPYQVRPGPNSLSTNYLSTIFKDSKGFLYVNGWDGGFIRFDPEKELFTIYQHDPADKNSVGSNHCHSFIEMDDGLIWFGTMGGGVNVFNPVTQKFKSFTTSDGLAHNNVTTLLKDARGRFWAGTRGGGISSFIPPKDPFEQAPTISFRNYDISDGLPSNVINLAASFCDTDGTLYFGTRDAGLFYFHPDDLVDNTFVPPVFITELKILNKTVSLYQQDSILKVPVEFTKSIKLAYNKNMLSFSFAALNYAHSEKNKYAYMLENYDDDWVYTDGSRRFVTYTNLDPGKYIFKVKGSNNDGVWNNVPAELSIVIVPPFWQTWWFKVLMVAVVMSIFYGFYRYRLGQINKLQTIRNNIASDLHDDIGSTLNSISIYSEVAKQQAGKDIPALNLIGDNSRKIIESMSDIVWTINPENDSFEKIIVRMRSFAHQMLKAKKIEYTFDADEKLNLIALPMQVRKSFYLVFKEAITNIVKYSNATRVSILLNEEDKTILLQVRDNGTGIPENAETKGNGLLNMKRRAEEIRADLVILTSTGEGTGIELKLIT